jgi:hypothetical protein
MHGQINDEVRRISPAAKSYSVLGSVHLSQQLGQLCDVDGDAPRLIAREQMRCRATV